jgi:metallo-beta-lactamase family protein
LNIELSFLGAAQNVTGSRYLIRANGKQILVDCGLHQERQFRERDWDEFPVTPASIDAVLLTHSHLDHCGMLPKLVRDGCRCPIYCTPATKEIAEIVLMDSARLQVEDTEFKIKRHRRENRQGPHPEIPLYTTEDVREALPFFSTVPYRKRISVADGIEAVFYDAGHILGSSMITMKIRQNSETRSIIFTGDMGREESPILRDPSTFDRADYIVMESTYGNRYHESRDESIAQLIKVINDTDRAGGNVVIPTFVVERAQDILYYLNTLLRNDSIPHLAIFLDSPMAVKVTEVFKRHPELFDEEMKQLVFSEQSFFNLSKLYFVDTVEASKAINHIKGTVVIIAGSGMCTGGRIKHHLVANITRKESTILFVGYQAQGTLGRLIVDGAKKVRILGKEYQVKAKIVQIDGFSAHADKNDLINWLKAFGNEPRRIFVTHGETAAAEELAATIRSELNLEAIAPGYLDKVSLD